MKNIILAILILIIAPLEIIACICTLGIYLIVIGDLITVSLVDKLD